MNLSFIILLGVFLIIALRKIGGFPVKIWQAMLAGAFLVILTGELHPLAALQAIDWDVMVFLLGMFLVGEGFILSGYLRTLAYQTLQGIRSGQGLVAALLLIAGVGSALFMNDTLAIVGTPLVLQLAKEHRLYPRLLLITLAVAITTGSVMSPIGNPQNLLIAIQGPVPSPFLTFLQYLAIPTGLNLVVAFLVLRVMLPGAFHAEPLSHTPIPLADTSLARLVQGSMVILATGIGLKIMSVAMGWPLDIRLSALATGAALPILLLSPHRLTLLRRVDWTTLIFFAAMFVLMASVWKTGIFQQWTARTQLDLQHVPSVLGFSIVLSQFISNVPLVALSLPLLGDGHSSVIALMALAAGSTIAGNLLILGAASNVIIIQRAEQEGHSLTFWEFARIGIPLTGLQTLIYAVYLGWLTG